MRIPLPSFVLLSSLILTIGCVFENEGTYVHPIEPPDGTGATITLDELNGRTIYAPVIVTLKVMPSGKQHYELRVKSTTGTIHHLTSSTGNFSFTIDPAGLSNGEHIWRIDVVYPPCHPALLANLVQKSCILK